MDGTRETPARIAVARSLGGVIHQQSDVTKQQISAVHAIILHEAQTIVSPVHALPLDYHFPHPPPPPLIDCCHPDAHSGTSQSGAFVFLLLILAYLGLSSIQNTFINDKVLHYICFFALTLCFYWVLDTSRRRTLNFTLIVCTAILGIGSEVVQGLLNNGRSFDPYDILCNILGSLTALALCTWYHKRMLDRKRLARHYHMVAGSDEGEATDLELGEHPPTTTVSNMEAELDNWDEHADEPWEEEGGDEHAEGTTTEESVGNKTPDSGSFGDMGSRIGADEAGEDGNKRLR
ncbi:MAG: hypothetical protein M1813_006217 [Trichoglossum hirsutum]|nr:MAG: hypothetical protein M1813_006217 [Trichoglossum hirsutum]